MNKFFLYFLCNGMVLVHLYAGAGDKPDSLKNILTATSGIEKANVILKITQHYLKNNHDSARKYTLMLQSLAQELHDTSLLGKTYYNLATIALYQGIYREADSIYKLSENLYRKANNQKGIADIFNSYGFLCEEKGDFLKAIENYLISYNISEKVNYDEGIANATNNMGVIYAQQERYDKALEYFLISLEKQTKLGNKRGAGNNLNNIAMIYSHRKNNTKALEYLEKAAGVWKEIKEKRGLAMTWHNMGNTLNVLGRTGEAMGYLQDSYRLCLEMNDNFGICQNLTVMGNIEAGKGHYSKALGMFNEALTNAEKMGSRVHLKNLYGNISKIYGRMNDYKNAYEYHLLYTDVKDSIYDEESSRQITEMQEKYESEKKEREIELLKKDKEIQKAEVRRQLILRNSFIGATVFTLLLALLGSILAFVLHNRYKLKKRANLELAQRNEKIQKQKEIIEEQKQNITDSIEYAGTIQQAVLPSEEEFKSLFQESFILYKPRDIVSGDFYWIAGVGSPLVKGVRGIDKDLSNPPSPPFSKGEIPAITNVQPAMLACCDCTGHGVPGAFMSMLCTALLNEAVNDKGINTPNEILEEVRRGIIAALRQKGKTGEAKDGMDATVISLQFRNVETLPSLTGGKHAKSLYTPNAMVLHAACANNPVFIVSNGILNEIKPDRYPVGFYEKELQPFTLHSADLKKGDMIFSLTDGFEDQLGGDKGKKFKSAQLKELLVSIAGQPVDQQKEILKKTFDEWKGEGEQTDDVTVIGIRI